MKITTRGELVSAKTQMTIIEDCRLSDALLSSELTSGDVGIFIPTYEFSSHLCVFFPRDGKSRKSIPHQTAFSLMENNKWSVENLKVYLANI